MVSISSQLSVIYETLPHSSRAMYKIATPLSGTKVSLKDIRRSWSWNDARSRDCVDGKATGPNAIHQATSLPIYTTWPNLIADASNGVLGYPCVGVKLMWRVLAVGIWADFHFVKKTRIYSFDDTELLFMILH